MGVMKPKTSKRNTAARLPTIAKPVEKTVSGVSRSSLA